MVRRILLAALMTIALEYVASVTSIATCSGSMRRPPHRRRWPTPARPPRRRWRGPRLSQHNAEALAAATDRDGLRNLHTAALERIARDNPGDASVLLRYAEALATDRRFDEAAQVFARVADAR